MGNREDIQAAARVLVRSQRFGAISARDIAREAGSSPAAINYHFRTLDALLLGALVDAMAELGEDVDSAIERAIAAGDDRRARQDAFWTTIIDSVVGHRALWLANFEALLEAESRPELRRLLAESTQVGAHEISTTLYGKDGDPSEGGRLVNALMVGLVVQHLLDPEAAPTSHQVADWLAEIGDSDAGGPERRG